MTDYPVRGENRNREVAVFLFLFGSRSARCTAPAAMLRGRVGRGKYKSWCILVSDDPGEEAKERLETLCKTNDGFAIAETDLKMRGPGDFIPAELGGRRQSGQLRFRLASLCDNTDMLLAAFSLAGEAVEGSSCSENIFHTM